MVKDCYIPERGDIIWIDLNPQAGTEMAKRRPCLVLTPAALNQKTHKCFIVPITNKTPKLLTHIALPNNLKTEGTLIVEQLRSLDFVVRNATKIEQLDNEICYTKVATIVQLLITD